MQTITRDELKRKIDQDEDLILIEALGAPEFRSFHLPGAINIPPGRNLEERVQKLVPDKQKPVVVYCRNEQCQASAQVARAMEQIGYHQVYHYPGGKEDWRAARMPVETGMGTGGERGPAGA